MKEKRKYLTRRNSQTIFDNDKIFAKDLKIARPKIDTKKEFLTFFRGNKNVIGRFLPNGTVRSTCYQSSYKGINNPFYVKNIGKFAKMIYVINMIVILCRF